MCRQRPPGLDPSQVTVSASTTPAPVQELHTAVPLRLTRWNISLSRQGVLLMCRLVRHHNKGLSSQPVYTCEFSHSWFLCLTQKCQMLWQILTNWHSLTTRVAKSWQVRGRVGVISTSNGYNVLLCNYLCTIIAHITSRRACKKLCRRWGLGPCDPIQTIVWQTAVADFAN